jgi:hypothetical protein
MVRNEKIFIAAGTDYFYMPIAWDKYFKDFHRHASKHTPVSSNVSSQRTHSFFFIKEAIVQNLSISCYNVDVDRLERLGTILLNLLSHFS